MAVLDGKVAIVTGGARSQGEAEARLFAKSGAAVAICDVLEAEGRALADELTAAGHAARFYKLDVSAQENWAGVVADVLAWQGRIDILVNNAGIVNRKTIETVSLEAWNRLLAVNLTGALLGIQAVVPAMRKAGGGSIINISSNSAFAGHYDPAYTCSKWALRGLTRTAAMEFVTDNIRVNSVCPGLIVTDLNRDAAHLEPMRRLTPMGRAGTSEEVADLVLFLAGSTSSYITGEDFTIDGGFTASAAYRHIAVEAGFVPPPNKE
ncbi:SDR family NAD(P)-dependent oxidoreductase [Enterovirga rhinocerotis]|uniref:NAD(P)-dependent dehydrogenase (Short-subunit alcohol dehydrogenase family) n=1 Tax=Enterovirga rhinocerotis TaxID=1339210 RepID=A0A4R7BTW6_9HYPH|nr:SDR family oxidoreductase [Enterovirga rhinocerotis]TDR89180.1 NAD(P)-dependent dehydrogenase (short-subunit alcohol dehydrogenase family) [Enterovirga rhinocerotis]